VSALADWIDDQIAEIRRDQSPSRRARLYRELAEEAAGRLRGLERERVARELAASSA